MVRKLLYLLVFFPSLAFAQKCQIQLASSVNPYSEYVCRMEADKGSRLAQYYYAQILFSKREYKNAISWAEKASKQGVYEAITLIGDIYSDKNYSDNSIEKSIEYYKAASLNDPKAMRVLAEEMLSKDKYSNKKAIDLLIDAGAMGNVNANTMLGEIYYRGMYGVKRDTERALYYLYEALGKGSAKSAYLISNIHDRGEGSIGPDVVMAYVGSVFAARKQEKYSLHMMNMRKKLSKEDFDLAKKLISSIRVDIVDSYYNDNYSMINDIRFIFRLDD